MIGYVPGDSAVHRAHPSTPLAIATGLLLVVFAVSAPGAVRLEVPKLKLGIVVLNFFQFLAQPSASQASACHL